MKFLSQVLFCMFMFFSVIFCTPGTLHSLINDLIILYLFIYFFIKNIYYDNGNKNV